MAAPVAIVTTEPEVLGAGKLSVDAGRADYAERIRNLYASSVEAIVATGRELVAAKAALAHGEFLAMVEQDLPFGRRTAHMLMVIAENPFLANGNHGSHLPASWRTLYELTRVDEPVLAEALADGRISPDMQRKHVQALLPARPVKAAPPEPKAAPTTEAEHERICDEYGRALAALVESAASGEDGMKRASAPQLKTLTKALDKLASQFGQLAELAPLEALSFYMQTRIDTLLLDKIEAERAAAPKYRCPNCDGVFPEYDLGTARECSRESCGASFVATDGENACPECNGPFTRLLEDNLCPECDDPEAVCELVAEAGA